ncbi:PAP2-domain-containing protein [Atractiella rhizophila]|nr:PAP2-domain-containing protein [Atractiella rhizophila]
MSMFLQAALIGLFRRSLYEAQTALLTTYVAQAVMRIIVDMIKLMVGRLRPDFFGRCQWDFLEQVCTGDPAVVAEGRKSFPSGHSSSTFTGVTIFVLFLAGKTKAFVPSVSIEDLHGPYLWRSARLLRFGITISPFILSFYVAMSRIQDHVHHPEDVLVGSLIGVFIATVTYHLYWPSPFNPNAIQGMAKPRDLQNPISLPSTRQEVEDEHLLADEGEHGVV